jgi:hypothetical protein
VFTRGDVLSSTAFSNPIIVAQMYADGSSLGYSVNHAKKKIHRITSSVAAMQSSTCIGHVNLPSLSDKALRTWLIENKDILS